MTSRIPSLLLARLQVMFTSGMTLQEVTEALDIELAEQEAEGEVADETLPQPETQVPIEEGKMPPAVLNHLFALVRTAQKLGAESYALAGHENVRQSESLMEISKNLSETTQSIAKLVNVISSFAPELKQDDGDGKDPESVDATNP